MVCSLFFSEKEDEGVMILLTITCRKKGADPLISQIIITSNS